MIRDCNTCVHHVQGGFLNGAPSWCWNCVRTPRGGVSLPFWKPKEKTEVSDGMSDAARDQEIARVYEAVVKPQPVPAPNPLDVQIGGTHYANMAIQPLEFAIANKLDFFQLNILKYITRRKGDQAKRIEDLKKAKHYLEVYIEAVENKGF